MVTSVLHLVAAALLAGLALVAALLATDGETAHRDRRQVAPRDRARPDPVRAMARSAVPSAPQRAMARPSAAPRNRT